jgi:uncharacterized protein YchJ
MGKQSRRKRRKTRPKPRRPDEAFQYGPLTIERFGRFTRLSNRSTKDQHAEFLRRAVEVNKDVLENLAAAIHVLQDLVRRHDPLQLMHRAVYEILPLFAKYRSEGEYTPEETYFLPSVEYLQYLIARTEPVTEHADLTDTEWKEVWGHARKVLELTRDYLFTRATLTNPPSETDSLRFILDGRRLMVRVNRYPFFLKEHFESSLTPYDPQLREIYGISSQSIVDGLLRIADYQRFGVYERYKDMLDAQQTLWLKLNERGYSTDTGASPDEVERTRAALESPEFAELYEDMQQKSALALTPAAFDITKLTNLPRPFLSLLSVTPGESVLTQITGPNYDDLSPLSTSVLHYKPFLELSGSFFVFYHSGLEDRIAEIIEADLFQKKPSQISEMAKRRSDRLEADAKRLLAGILLPDFACTNIYYPNPDDPGGLTELDVLLGVDDALFLVEAKAGGFSEAASRGAPRSMEKELSDLIIEGQRQSERAERYIRSSGEVVFFDESGKAELKRIKQGDFRRIFRVVVTREELGWVGARIAALSILDPNLSKSYPWHISIDDLRIVETLFRGEATRFVHYLEQRLRASAEVSLARHDEIDHIGLYNKLNQYESPPVEGLSRMSFDSSYMRDIDHYFMERVAGKSPPVPTQQMPPRMSRLLRSLDQRRVPHRFEVGSLVLSFGGSARGNLAKSIELLDRGISEGRARSVRIPIDDTAYGITITYASAADWLHELKRTAVQMKVSKGQRWLVIQLDAKGEISKVEVVSVNSFSDSDLASEFSRHEKMVQRAIHTERPGRNSLCPCGSGRKFKKCHGSAGGDA